MEHRSDTGYFSIEALDLNRQALCRLRKIRDRLTSCDKLVAEGVRGLRTFPIDLLPPEVRGRALRFINIATAEAAKIADDIDSLLRASARSLLIDEDPEAASRTEERMAGLKHLETLFPGSWRAPRRERK